YKGTLISKDNINLPDADKGIGNLKKSGVKAAEIKVDILADLLSSDQPGLPLRIISWEEK
ncbi:MAG: hypothetical protein R6V17_05385, partial [Halanaerobacter sp.]